MGQTTQEVRGTSPSLLTLTRFTASSPRLPRIESEPLNVASGTSSSPAGLRAIGTHAPVASHTISSLLASASSTAVFYPFDLLKTRYVSQDGTVARQHNGLTYSSVYRSLRTIVAEEGVGTLFRGCSVALIGSVTAWGLYMSIYREICNRADVGSFAGRTCVSITASLISSILSSPIFLVKCRMQLEEVTKGNNYRTFRKGVHHIVQNGGVLALWRGVPLQMVLVFPNALAIPMYDSLKSLVLRYRWKAGAVSRDLNLYEVCMCSTITKTVLLAVSHPLVMMKVRIQDQRALDGPVQYRRMAHTLQTILTTRGFSGLYRGFHTSLLHALPRSLLHYVIYEKTLNFLCKHYH